MQTTPGYQTQPQGRELPDEDGHDRALRAAETLDRVYEPVREGLYRALENVESLSRSQPPHLLGLLDHVLESTGKRMRPAIVLLASNFHPNDGKNAEIMASAVELLHIATLIHDDTVDSSDVRRGKATASSVWGSKAAVLLGDYVFASSATFVCDTGNIRVIRRFAETIMELSSGELYEMAGAYNSSQTREQYLDQIYNKTASLFTTAGEAGAVLSGAPERVAQALKEYGFNLGMAFQIVDDILDFDATREEVGKPVGRDLAQGILTLPAIMAIEQYPTDNPIVTLCEHRGDESSLRRAVDMIQSSSIIADSLGVAEQYAHKALDSLGELEPNRSRESLEELVSYAVSRRS